MIDKLTGYTYIDAVLALVPLAKFYPAESGKYEDCEWVDDRDQPSVDEVNSKLAELKSLEGLFYLREARDLKLKETDTWGLQDYPATNEQLAYRQALRDITENYTSLDDVVWPDKPL